MSGKDPGCRNESSYNVLTRTRLCKKVAELAQVVHLLFISNHEKQMEIDCLIDAYEYEISQVIDDAQAWIRSGDDAVTEHKRNLKEAVAELGRVQHQLETLTEQYDQLKEKERRQCEELSEVKEECQKLRDLLITDQCDLQRLKENLEDELKEKGQLLSKRDNDIERMAQRMARLETSLLDMQRNAEQTVKIAQKRVRSVEQELNRMRLELNSAHRSRDTLIQKQRSLEKELKDYQKTVGNQEKPEEKSDSNNTTITTNSNSSKSSSSNNNNNNHNTNNDVELELLKKELKRYRLELSNRDKNFSQLFVPSSHCAAGITAQRGTLIADKQTGILARQFTVSQDGYKKNGRASSKIIPTQAERRLYLAYHNNNYRRNQGFITNSLSEKSTVEKLSGFRLAKHWQTAATSFRGKPDRGGSHSTGLIEDSTRRTLTLKNGRQR